MIKYSIEKHTVAGSTKLLATNGGEHILNLVVDSDGLDNGMIVAPNKCVALDNYSYKDSTGFAGTIVGKAANGNWYVHVDDPGDAVLVLSVPLVYEEYSNKFKAEQNFYNDEEDTARGYVLHKYDVFELSAEGFTGTPVKDKAVTVSDKKLAVTA